MHEAFTEPLIYKLTGVCSSRAAQLVTAVDGLPPKMAQVCVQLVDSFHSIACVDADSTNEQDIRKVEHVL